MRGGEESVGRGREGESVCCLLVLDSVTSTPQWIRQPRPRGCVSSRVFSIPTLACVLMHNEMHARAETARGRESKCERARVVCSGPFKKFFPCNHLRAREKRSNTIPIKALIFLWTLGMMRASDPSFCPDPAPHPGVNCRVHT